MSYDLIPRSFFTFPTLQSIVEDDEFPTLSTPQGVTISEDTEKVYIEASLPGIDPKEVEITFDKGVLWIKGEKKEEDTGKKYYRKAIRSFSYRVGVPGEIDTSKDPEAMSEHGVMKISFFKSPQSQQKKAP